jgi:hypothetical protein
MGLAGSRENSVQLIGQANPAFSCLDGFVGHCGSVVSIESGEGWVALPSALGAVKH